MPFDNEKLIKVRTVDPPRRSLPLTGQGHVVSMEEYKQWYQESIDDPAKFFGERARTLLDWIRPFDTALQAAPNFSDSPAWFINGQLNASYNAVDRHALKDPNRVALIFEADEPGNSYKVTYSELQAKVCQTANLLYDIGVRKGDIVTVYLPMIPEAIYTLLAIVRIGAIHSVVFAGFSPGALRDRIQDAKSKFLVTADQGVRAGKIIETKKLADEALKGCPEVKNVVVVKKSGAKVNYVKGRDICFNDIANYKTYFAPEPVNSEHPLFLLYTSGSTGKPKGLVHATGGYLLATLLSCKHVFGISDGDILFTAADIGWVTGHSHALYGPLLLGATTVIYEGTPVYPSHTRLWEIVDNNKVTQLYTSPTAIRLLRKFGTDDIKKFDLSSLRVLGTVGEPIAKDVWEWFYENVGRGRCSICDTYWLTESAMILLSSLPGVTPMRPGGAGLPFFGVKPVLLDPQANEVTDRPGEGILVLQNPWPSIARTVNGDHERYKDTYLRPYPGFFFTGDGAAIDSDGTVFISGRVDDVVNVSGHRLSTAEVEAALLQAVDSGNNVANESAVVGIEDPVTGQALMAFTVLNRSYKDQGKNKKDEAVKLLIESVRQNIGPFAAPKKLFIVEDLPKTRSGKIMRRILRKIVTGQQDQLGETSTLNDPSVVDHLISVVQANKTSARL